MSKQIKIGTISKEELRKIDRKISREIDIEENLNVSYNRVHKSQKSYTRKDKHRGIDFEE